jgi:hypothetical protein
LADARAVLSDYRPVPRPGAQARVWQSLAASVEQSAPPRRWLTRRAWLWLPVPATALALALLWVWPHHEVMTEPTTPQHAAATPTAASTREHSSEVTSGPQELRLTPGQTVVFGHAVGRAVVPSTVVQSPAAFANTTLALQSGALEVALPPGAATHTLQTRLARFDFAAAHFSLSLSDGTARLDLASGDVSLLTVSNEKATARAGERLEIDALGRVHRLHGRLPKPPEARAEAAVEASQPTPPDPSEAMAPATNEPEVAQPPSTVATPEVSADAEVLTMLRQADLARKAGNASKAVSLYQTVATHPAAAAFAEEALLRAAMLYWQPLGRAFTAEELLSQAQARFPRGALAQERTALLARIMLARGDAPRAVSLVEAYDGPQDVALLRVRLELAAALPERSKPWCLRFLTASLSADAPHELRSQAQAVCAAAHE